MLSMISYYQKQTRPTPSRLPFPIANLRRGGRGAKVDRRKDVGSAQRSARQPIIGGVDLSEWFGQSGEKAG